MLHEVLTGFPDSRHLCWNLTLGCQDTLRSHNELSISELIKVGLCYSWVSAILKQILNNILSKSLVNANVSELNNSGKMTPTYLSGGKQAVLKQIVGGGGGQLVILLLHFQKKIQSCERTLCVSLFLHIYPFCELHYGPFQKTPEHLMKCQTPDDPEP